MFGQLIRRLTTSPISPVVGEERPAGQESPIRQENPVRQWRVVSQDGASSLFDLGFLAGDPALPQRDPVESTASGTRTKAAAPPAGAPAPAWNDTTKKMVVASFSINAPKIASQQRFPTSPNIGMPSALPRTTEILQAAAASCSIEKQEPSRHRTPPLRGHSTQPDRIDRCVKKAVHADSSSPVTDDVGAISRSLVADAAAAGPDRFRQASPLALLKTPAANREIDANLAKIITQWSSLTWPIQAAVLAMVDAAAHESVRVA